MKQNRLIAALGAVLLLLPTLAGCAQNPGQTSSSSPSASPMKRQRSPSNGMRPPPSK